MDIDPNDIKRSLPNPYYRWIARSGDVAEIGGGIHGDKFIAVYIKDGLPAGTETFEVRDPRLHLTRSSAINYECNRLLIEAENCRDRLVEIDREFAALKGKM